MAVTALFVGCSPEVIDETPEMTEVGEIEVTFSVDGEDVRSLDLASVSHTIKVDVTLNNDGVYWNAISDQAWCQIVEETHRGTGSFTMVINANESFEAREEATITFVAGEYEVDMLTVLHNGNVFVLDQVYAASTKAAGSFSTKVKTTAETGEDWGFECDPWITATKGAVTTNAEGEFFTEITIAWEANADASRYGEVKLVKNGKNYADGWINIWQFGTELAYDENGNISLEAKDAAPLELRVPKQTVKEITMPSWVTVTTVENSDNTVSYMLQFAGNPSDANHIRTTELSLSLLSGAADIKLPVIKQMYYPMEGLLTGPGLALFAKTWNEGGDVSQWYVDGVPTLMGDVDLTEVTEWVSIGTAGRPWTGEFNGNGKKLINFNSTQPLFGVCENATIKNIIFDETSKFSLVGSYSGELCLAPLAGSIKTTTVEGCSNVAEVSLDASCTTADNLVYIAGLVAKADAASSIKSCEFSGRLNIPSSCTSAAGSSLYAGSLVAYNEGTVEDSFAYGVIDFGAQITTSYVGGIVGYNAVGAVVRNTQNSTPINYSSKRGSSGTFTGYVGGIVGYGNGTISGNKNEGDINSTSNINTLYAGGITSYLDDANAVFADNSQANSADIVSGGKTLVLYAGGLVGYVGGDYSINIDFASYDGTTLGNISITESTSHISNAAIYAGGLFGYVNSDVVLANPTWEGTINIKMASNDIYVPTRLGGIIGTTNGIVNITNATTAGTISVNKPHPTKSSQQLLCSVGGVVGECHDSVLIKDSTNNIEFSWAQSAKRVQYYSVAIGGIVGRIDDVNAEINNCHNKGTISHSGYNNATFDTIAKSNYTGGIVGCYSAIAGNASNRMIVKNCTNMAAISALRGFVAGIVGFAKNATIEDCSYTVGRINDQVNPHAAGIIGGAYDSTIKNCTATIDISTASGGSCDSRGGGIVAIASGKTCVENCSYYGKITLTPDTDTDPTEEYVGGIVAYGDENSIAKDSRYGGDINGVTISSSNYLKYAIGIGDGNGTIPPIAVSNISYWNGK